MRRAAALLMVCGVLGLVGAANAFELRQGDQVVVEEGEVIHDDLIAVGQTVTVRGRVEGDLVAMGQSVIVAGGSVGGLTVALGNNVQVDTETTGTVLASGNNVVIGGSVGRNLAAAGSSVIVNEGTEVGMDAALAGATVLFDGVAGRDLRSAGADIRISGQVGGDAVLDCKKATLAEGAVVKGDLVAICPDAPEVASGASVEGQTKHQPPGKKERKKSVWLRILTSVIGVAGVFLVALLMSLLVPRFTAEAGGNLRSRPGVSVGLGLASHILWPIAVGICCATVLGIPLGIVVLLLYGVAGFAGFSVSAIYVGGLILRSQRSLIPAALLGAVVLGVLMLIPIVGGLVLLAAWILGMGGLILATGSAIGRQRAPVAPVEASEVTA